jgi:glucose-1-phosphatase
VLNGYSFFRVVARHALPLRRPRLDRWTSEQQALIKRRFGKQEIRCYNAIFKCLDSTAMKLKNIIFDLGGVILNIDPQLTLQAFTNFGAPDIHVLYANWEKIELFLAFEMGKISAENFRKHLKALLLLDSISDADFDAAWNAMLIDLSITKLEYIKSLQKNYRTFLYSNTNTIHLDEIFKIVQRSGVGSFSDYFEAEYYSCHLGMRKPDPASFEAILRQNQLRSEETLFIDDTLVNIEGAKIVGLRGLHLQEPLEAVLEELA